MASELLRRYVEESFGFSADIRHIPLDSSSLAEDLSSKLEAPIAKEPLEKLFQESKEFPELAGMALIIDSDRIFLHLILNKMSIPDSEEAVKFVNYEAERITAIRRAFDSSMSQTRISAFVSLIPEGKDLDFSVSEIVKRTVKKDSGMLGLGRAEDYPPSGFIVAVIDHTETT